MISLNIGSLQEPLKSKLIDFYEFITNQETPDTLFQDIYDKYHRQSLTQLSGSLENRLENFFAPDRYNVLDACNQIIELKIVTKVIGIFLKFPL